MNVFVARFGANSMLGATQYYCSRQEQGVLEGMEATLSLPAPRLLIQGKLRHPV
jgi:hypothetical protein